MLDFRKEKYQLNVFFPQFLSIRHIQKFSAISVIDLVYTNGQDYSNICTVSPHLFFYILNGISCKYLVGFFAYCIRKKVIFTTHIISAPLYTPNTIRVKLTEIRVWKFLPELFHFQAV